MNGEALQPCLFRVDHKVAIPPDSSLNAGQVLVQPVYLSVDTNMYFRMDGQWETKFNAGLLPLNQVVRGFGLGIVLASQHPQYESGERVMGWEFPWASYGVVNGGPALIPLRDQLASLPAQWFMGVLSMHSFSAWYGLTKLALAKPGETVLVSAATSGVGQMVVQLAGIMGLKVVAVVGSTTKVNLLKKNRYVTRVFNYYAMSDRSEALSQYFPDGVDIYFDCVSGAGIDNVLTKLNRGGRIIMGGLMSDNAICRQSSQGVKKLTLISATNSTILGFNVKNIYQAFYGEFVRDMLQLIDRKKVSFNIDLVCGIENGPQALSGVMAGKNLGKCIIQVSADESLEEETTYGHHYSSRFPTR
ncbi:hypothetical protein BJ085DRAFT_19693 [Dimargaris cristalligena]|uniref:Enoyl reductase (ER) domain-containing protein n=1 Tax=Dimargaris cristalligena TaxID=215637 RepID=A0A4P9ZQ34_9FUNG|nr:hypothetical protein BJ085DRAFT_19693 [Dimargaris cristalligena]|eukprot:RKP35574.1 hypothetical protein BJ085DRAFT_19693 [Dimargaris cristalligena]